MELYQPAPASADHCTRLQYVGGGHEHTSGPGPACKKALPGAPTCVHAGVGQDGGGVGDGHAGFHY
jgi:hypothetical protein